MTFWAVETVELISLSGDGCGETKRSFFLRSVGVEHHIPRPAKPVAGFPPPGTLIIKGIDPRVLMELPEHPTQIGFICARGALHIFPVEQSFVTGADWAEFRVSAPAD
jgi:hypothetical protein